MLAKKTSKNQITLPKRIVAEFPDVDYFDVVEENGTIVLKPLRPSRSEQVRRKLADIGIDAEDIEAAIKWARKG